MRFISGHQALNLPCSLETCGDWHTSALQWDKLNYKESEGSIFGDYGLEICTVVPNHKGEEIYIANTLRALLDLMIDDKLSIVQGAREDFICNESYTAEFLNKVLQLRNLPNWAKIDTLMKREYGWAWVKIRDAK